MASILNWRMAAIAPSAVFFISENVGASSVFAIAFKAMAVSLALIPVWANILLISTIFKEETPRLSLRFVISLTSGFNPWALLPVT